MKTPTKIFPTFQDTGGRQVFNIILALSSTFLVIYFVGLSVPAWYFFQERVSNLSSCASADAFIGSSVRQSLVGENTVLSIYSSLWYVQIQVYNDVDDNDATFQKTVPFIFLRKPKQIEERPNGLNMQRMLPLSLTPVFMFVFLSMAAGFILTASQRASRRVYYGLATVFLDAAITIWMITSTSSSEGYLFSVASSFCVQQGHIHSSISLMMTVGSCAIIAFLLGCILIHLAVTLRSMSSFNNKDDSEDILDIICDNDHHNDMINSDLFKQNDFTVNKMIY